MPRHKPVPVGYKLNAASSKAAPIEAQIAAVDRAAAAWYATEARELDAARATLCAVPAMVAALDDILLAFHRLCVAAGNSAEVADAAVAGARAALAAGERTDG